MNKQFFHRWRIGAERRLLRFSEAFGANLRMDLTPDEPDYARENGEVVENKDNRIEGMDKERFKAHLHDMFQKNYNYKFRFCKNIPEKGSVENLLGGAMEHMLEDIAVDVFENPDYQQGVANYHDIYVRSWDMYLDYVNEYGNTNDPLWCHISRMRGAPGIYNGSGELVTIPRMYMRRMGRAKGKRSEYAKQWLRRKMGGPDPLEERRAYALEKAESIRKGYGRIWQKNITQRIRTEERREPADGEVEARIEELITNRLGEKISADRYAKGLPPPPPPPKEVMHRHVRSMEGNVPLAYRTKAGKKLNEAYPNLRARNEKDIDKQFTFELKKEGEPRGGIPTVIEVEREGVQRSTDYIKGFGPARGVLVMHENIHHASESHVEYVDYKQADEMVAVLKSRDPYITALKHSKIFTDAMRDSVINAQAIPSDEWRYYSSDEMVLLKNHIFPKLKPIIDTLQAGGIQPRDFSNLHTWDKATKGPVIAAHMNAHPEMFGMWANVLLVLCKDFRPSSPEKAMEELLPLLGVTPSAPAAPASSPGVAPVADIYDEEEEPEEVPAEEEEAETVDEKEAEPEEEVPEEEEEEAETVDEKEAEAKEVKEEEEDKEAKADSKNMTPEEAETTLSECTNKILSTLKNFQAEQLEMALLKLDVTIVNGALYINRSLRASKELIDGLTEIGYTYQEKPEGYFAFIKEEGAVPEKALKDETLTETVARLGFNRSLDNALSSSRLEGDKLKRFTSFIEKFRNVDWSASENAFAGSVAEILPPEYTKELTQSAMLLYGKALEQKGSEVVAGAGPNFSSRLTEVVNIFKQEAENQDPEHYLRHYVVDQIGLRGRLINAITADSDSLTDMQKEKLSEIQVDLIPKKSESPVSYAKKVERVLGSKNAADAAQSILESLSKIPRTAKNINTYVSSNISDLTNNIDIIAEEALNKAKESE